MRLTSIATGEQGTLETLRIMAGLARESSNYPEFLEFAHSFSSASDVNRNLYHLFEYQDEEIETLISPETNLEILNKTGKLIGDCDDIAMFYAAIFYALGIPARFVAMKTKKNDPDFLHVVAEAFEDNRWKRFDPTVKPGLIQIDYGRMTEYV